MKRVFATVFAVLVGFSMFVTEAEAKRLGGGMSSGMSRNSSVMQRQATPPTRPATVPGQAAQPAAAPVPQPSGMSRWMGPIAGLAAGLGIAALMSHFGLGEGMGNIVMIMLLVFAGIFVLRLLFARRQPQSDARFAGAGMGSPNPQDTMQFHAGYEAASPVNNVVTATEPGIPANFDSTGFLRQAKLNFVRLQAANDAGNMEDIRGFATPEMFAEIQLEFQERGRTQQQTEVVQLDAVLLDVTDEAKQQIASVRFHGWIREEPHSDPQAFNEVWHLVRPIDSSTGWVIAGIQQTQ